MLQCLPSFLIVRPVIYTPTMEKIIRFSAADFVNLKPLDKFGIFSDEMWHLFRGGVYN